MQICNFNMYFRQHCWQNKGESKNNFKLAVFLSKFQANFLKVSLLSQYWQNGNTEVQRKIVTRGLTAKSMDIF